MKKTFHDYGINTGSRSSGGVKTLCPKCSHTRKKSKDPCLSVNIDKETWFCHNGGCDFKGCLKNSNGFRLVPIKSPFKKPHYSTEGWLSDKARDYLNTRKITDEVLARNKITDEEEYMPQVEVKVNVLRFPYFKSGEVVNIKYRDGQKNFKMVKDAELSLYGFDDIQGDTLIWCEGEIDKLSLEVAGLKNCVSVPNGAKSNLDFLESHEEKLKPIIRHILALDNDEAGKELEVELLRRFGSGKCESVEWPYGCKDANDILVGHGPEKLRACVDNAKPYPVEEGLTATAWEEPITPGQIETPDIPSSVLPTWLMGYVQELSDNTQTPMSMAVLMALSVVSTCTQKRFEVSPYGDDYKEPLSLWTVTAMPPASRKTAITAALTGPLDTWEREQQARMKDEIASVETKRAINLKAIDRLSTEASKTGDSLERKSLIKEIDELKANTPDEVFPPRLWTGDVTPERLQGLLVEQGERMSLISDEGGIFEIMGGLYSDGRANLDVFLQSHAGKSIRVDRGKRTVCLDKPALAFGLAIQPSVLNDFGYGSKKRFRGNGTLARFLYCVPKSNIGTRKMGKRTPISEAIKLAYNDNISALLEIQPHTDDEGTEIPRVLSLSPEALKAWEEFSQGVENKQGEYGEFEPIQDWTGKLPGASLRIAGNCHVAEHEDQTLIISLETMERALELCGLLIQHAQSAFGMMGTDPTVDDAEVILKWVASEGKESFTRGYCHKVHRGRFRKLDRLVKALDILHEWNVISGPEIMKPKTAGRPSIVYHVNPFVLKGGQ